MRWVDPHIHIGEDQDGVSATLSDVESLFAEDVLDAGVVFCFDEVDGIAAGNERIRDIVAAHDHLEGLFRVDPKMHEPDVLRAADWAAGFKLHPRSQDFSMQRVYDHLQVAADLEKPVLVHTGGWSNRAHPEEIIDAADVHRETTIIAAHNMKGYYYKAPTQYVELMQALDNLLIETSLYCTPGGLTKLVEDLGADRVMFASDYPYGHPVPMQKNVELADISDEAKATVAGGNADRLFF